jgi:hypothetical protein
MKKILLILVVFFCFVLTGYKTFFYLDHRSEQKEIVQNSTISRLNTTEISKIQEGDFILRRGFGYFSDYIATSLNTGPVDITHAGIIVKRNSTFYVIHCLSSDVSKIDGVQLQSLSQFLYYSAPDKIIVTRAKSSDAAFGKKVTVLAEGYLAKRIPFDHNGTIDDSSALFCTELIWQILEKDLKYAVLPAEAATRKKFFHSMTPMYSTEYFDIIVNQYEKENRR